MAKYSDYIRLQNFLSVYDLTSETSDSLWQTFIPTGQFCDLLQKSITAMTSAELNKRKSLWIQGTFGTGKSHAASVIKHLFYDDLDEIGSYINNIEDVSLRNKVLGFRQKKKYFSIVLKGAERAYDIPRFSLTIQREVKKALSDYEIVVDSDFEIATNWIEKNDKYLGDILEENDELSIIAPSKKEILHKLQNKDIDLYLKLEEALRVTLDVHLSQKNISDWLVSVEQEVEKKGIADGLIILWDEFTSVMDTIKSDRINILQNIAEKSQQCNLFLFIISHRLEEQSHDNRGKDISKMNDRFEIVRYTMDEVSTYRIMKHTYKDVSEDDSDYQMLKHDRINKFKNIVQNLAEGNSAEEQKYINELFPLHPYTAFLCSKLSDYIGSANRSVINFMNDEEKGFRRFIDDENTFDIKQLLTAEWLWDFFIDEFKSDSQCSIITNTYSTNKEKVLKKGDDYIRVFKAILLLNAIGTKFTNSGINHLIPSVENIKMLFAYDRAESKLDNILDYLHDSNIIERNVFGEYKVTSHSLNPTELAKAREQAKLQYKSALDFLNYNTPKKEDLLNLFRVGENLIRKCDPQFFSGNEQEGAVLSKLQKYLYDKPNSLHVALFLSVNDSEREYLENRLKEISLELKDAILILPYEPFTTEYQNKFIDFIATYNVAKSHYQEAIAKESAKSANEFINKWISRLLSGTYSVYFNGKIYKEGVVSNIHQLINKQLSHQVFPKGFESIQRYRTETMTFFANKNYPGIITQVLQAPLRDKLIKFSGQSVPASNIFEENNNFLVDEQGNLTETAQYGNSWLSEICREVDKCIDNARKTYQDKFSLSEIFESLIKPPYGIFRNQANYVAFTYALRKHKADLFVPGISQPVSDEKLADIILGAFKIWDEGKYDSSSKLLLRFGSPEESKLTKQLFELFNLQDIDGIPEAKSLDNVRWGVCEFCKEKAKYPLWSLTHCDSSTDELSKIIIDIIDLFDTNKSSDLSKIKELSKSIHSARVDLTPFIRDINNYRIGFYNYVSQIERDSLKDTIKKEWWNDLESELSRMQSEIAFRRREDVEKRIMAFYIDKTRLPKGGTTSTPSNQDNLATSETITSARDSVKKANMPNALWQKVLLDLLMEHPEVSAFINKYLS